MLAFPSENTPGNVRGPWEKQKGTMARKGGVFMSFRQRDEERMTWKGYGEGGDLKGNLERVLKAFVFVIKEREVFSFLGN